MPRRDEEVLSPFDATPYRVQWMDGHLSEESVYAWLDGALAASESTQVDEHVRQCELCAAAVAEARGFIAASVRIMHAADLSPSVPKRSAAASQNVANTLARITAFAGIADVEPARAEHEDVTFHVNRIESRGAERNRWWNKPTLLRVAAVALLMVSGGYILARDKSRDVDRLAAVVQPAPEMPRTVLPTVASPVVAQSSAAVSMAVTDAASKASTGVPTNSGKPAIVAQGPIAQTPIAQTPTPEPLNAQPLNAQAPSTARLTSASPTPPLPPQTLPGVVISGVYRERRIEMATATASVVEATPGFRTITGRIVDAADRRPIHAVNVLAQGTTLQALTDSAGRFVLDNVPLDVKQLRAMRIGYDASNIKIDVASAPTLTVDIGMRASTLMLSSVVVTSVGENPKQPSRTMSCWILPANLSGASSPIIQRLHLITDKGAQFALLTGWPGASDETRVPLVVGLNNALIGTAARRDSRLEIELQQSQDSWIGTFREYRNGNVRTESLRFVKDTSTKGCS